jgi:hypothetical protein
VVVYECLDNWYLREIGCVSDYDLAFANPTQSLTVQDRSGAADGTCSASGVTQVQPVVQGNLTSLAVSSGTAVTPADGQVVIGPGTGGNDPKLIVGGAGNAQLKVRHIDGKQSYNADMGSLYLNQYSTGDVVMGAGGGDVIVTNGTEAKLQLRNTKDWGGSDSGNIGTLDFYTTDPSGAGARVVGAVQCAQNAASAAPNGELVFKTAAGGGSAAAAVERMRIASTGAITAGLETGNTAQALTVTGGTNAVGNIVALFQSNDNTKNVNIRNNGQLFVGGLATFSGGINLGNQTMSSYQTGDWYPLLYYQNGTDVTIGGTAYASQAVSDYTVTWGHYVKVGKLVHVEGYLKVTTATTGSFANDNIGIQGLPFSHRNATNANAMLMINTTKNWGNTIASGVVGPNSTVAVCQTSSGGGNLADDIGAVTNLQVWINGTYFTEA